MLSWEDQLKQEMEETGLLPTTIRALQYWMDNRPVFLRELIAKGPEFLERYLFECQLRTFNALEELTDQLQLSGIDRPTADMMASEKIMGMWFFTQPTEEDEKASPVEAHELPPQVRRYLPRRINQQPDSQSADDQM